MYYCSFFAFCRFSDRRWDSLLPDATGDERGNGIAVKNRGKETISSRHHYLRFGMSSEWPDRIYSMGMTGHGVGGTPNEVRRLVSSWSPTFVCGVRGTPAPNPETPPRISGSPDLRISGSPDPRNPRKSVRFAGATHIPDARGHLACDLAREHRRRVRG